MYIYSHKSKLLVHILKTFSHSEFEPSKSPLFRTINIDIFLSNIIICDIKSVGDAAFLKRPLHYCLLNFLLTLLEVLMMVLYLSRWCH